jgi:hypothetical protein
MEPPPLFDESPMVLLHQSNRLPNVDPAHVMVLPKRRLGPAIAQANDHLPTVRTLDVNVEWMVLSWR